MKQVAVAIEDFFGTPRSRGGNGECALVHGHERRGEDDGYCNH